MTQKLETLQNQHDLIMDQIDNIERSGFFTDAQIKQQTKPLYAKIYNLKIQIINQKIADSFCFKLGLIKNVQTLKITA